MLLYTTTNPKAYTQRQTMIMKEREITLLLRKNLTSAESPFFLSQDDDLKFLPLLFINELLVIVLSGHRIPPFFSPFNCIVRLIAPKTTAI